MAKHNGIALSSLTAFWLITLASCSVNPFRADNELTGTATGTAIGAGAGAATAYIAGASKAEIGLTALVGAAAGYYISSLSFSSGGITHVGGKIYTLGDLVTIEIPSDMLFDVNTSDLLTEAGPVLDSVIAVLKRYPNNNIMISGNTNGYYFDRYERALSENRARQVAAYLWAHGINNFTDQNSNYGSLKDGKNYTRRLRYVGYGSYFPISSDLTAQGRSANNRIQITSYPKRSKLHMNKCGKVFTNIGSVDGPQAEGAQLQAEINNSFREDSTPESRNPPVDTLRNDTAASDDPDLNAEKWVN